ncbi:DNA damage repair protein (Rad9) [Penicillium citrinum]|uniref:DNA damage repair protein (Rad9) n=1 Tax=Penicillium citrinum TaxID=5077 RepID=A0A9W9P9Y0_PENCI|nr:DNA damage repair protein (Rad9) [Penicillium citrinum]KAJ5240646.1 DNA damage repair protein (Rad9) [Penicillium citrinum]
MAMEFIFFTGFNLINVIDWSVWSFGQIVAITLWFLIAINLVGTEQYSKARIPGPYKIIKQLHEEDEGVSNSFVKS